MQKNKLIIFMPFIGGGGVEKNLFLISNYLSKKINHLIICTTSKSEKKKFNKKIKFLFTKKEFSQKTNVRLKYIYCLYVLYKYLKVNKNVVVLSFQANVYCIILCKLLGVKVIARSNSSPSGWYHNFLKKIIYKKIISLADEVIVNSLEFKKQMDKRFNLKVKCIFNPLNKKDIIKSSNMKSSERFFKSQKKYLKILNIGRLTKQKDQITILKALNILKQKIDFRFLILGRGVEKDNLQKFINENKLNNSVKLRGFTKNPYPIIKQTDIFVLSSRYEGLPNVLLEAASLKKIIFSTNCPTGPKEILLNGKGGFFFNIGNHYELAEKINIYYKNKKKFQSKIKETYNNLARYDFKKNLQKYFLTIKPYLN